MSDRAGEVLLATALPLFLKEYPRFEKLPITEVPAFIREQEPDLQFAPHYQLHSDRYTIQVGPKSFSLLRKGDYLGWSDFGPRVVSVVQAFLNAGLVNQVQRASLRYTNFFEHDIFPKLGAKFALGETPLSSNETMIRTLLDWEGFSHILLISNTARQDSKLGSVIDVDSLALNPPSNFVQNFPDLVERLHLAEKSLFYSLLNQEFVETLKPEY